MPPTAAPPALIFDFGNVVAFFDYARSGDHLARMLGLEATGQELLDGARRRGLAPLVARYERGEIEDVAFLDELASLLDIPATADQLRAAWADIFWLNEPVADLIDRLAADGHVLVLGSNTNAIHADGFLDRFADTFRHFRAIVLSYQLGHSKPSPEFYLACADATGRPPGQCLFIDDLAENVDGARATGLLATRFIDASRLALDLRDHGIEI